MRKRCSARHHPRRGFSAIEMAVVSMLTALLSVIMSSVWMNFCKPALEASARCRMALEANLAAASFSRDFGGNLADSAGRVGVPLDGRFTGRMIPASGWLRICYHGGNDTDPLPKWATPDVVISYQLDGNRLIRTDENAGTQVVVATNLTSFSVTDNGAGTGVVISMMFALRGLTATYTHVALDPPNS